MDCLLPTYYVQYCTYIQTSYVLNLLNVIELLSLYVSYIRTGYVHYVPDILVLPHHEEEEATSRWQCTVHVLGDAASHQLRMKVLRSIHLRGRSSLESSDVKA